MIADFINFISNNPAYRAGLFFCLGLCIGSFITAITYRIPRKLNWITDRSRCTSCQHVLGAADLVPLLSWILSHGRCRHCGARVSIRYPTIELVFGVAFAIISVL